MLIRLETFETCYVHRVWMLTPSVTYPSSRKSNPSSGVPESIRNGSSKSSGRKLSADRWPPGLTSRHGIRFPTSPHSALKNKDALSHKRFLISWKSFASALKQGLTLSPRAFGL